MLQFTINTKDLLKVGREVSNMGKHFPELAEKIRWQLASFAKEEAKRNVKPNLTWRNSTGYLKESIIFKKDSKDATNVIAGADYAAAVELGADEHPIKYPPGSKGDILSRYWKTEIGKPHSPGSERVHPGSKAMGFMTKAYNSMLNNADKIINMEFDKFFNKIR